MEPLHRGGLSVTVKAIRAWFWADDGYVKAKADASSLPSLAPPVVLLGGGYG